jgi:hypothetical protein
VLHLFELPRTLRRPLHNERQLMEAFVAREAAHVADVASRQVCLSELVQLHGLAAATFCKQIVKLLHPHRAPAPHVCRRRCVLLR